MHPNPPKKFFQGLLLNSKSIKTLQCNCQGNVGVFYVGSKYPPPPPPPREQQEPTYENVAASKSKMQPPRPPVEQQPTREIIVVEREEPDPVPNLMWASIIVTVCCNLPFGIIAIMYSSQANEYAAGGNTAAALKSNSKARVYIKIAIFLGIVSYIVTYVLVRFPTPLSNFISRYFIFLFFRAQHAAMLSLNVVEFRCSN
ncbi:uncharacterized protein LOC115230236 [Octopus sinensis]|uniref:Uncharacterized protein LOC115230236 n=1 Tax=Octopus sinensis TaxID=2607531 RepID=A0A7E6EKH3_9MOLL|nr:uncharacterized protein LOC115230236 [Octopus sinensis]